MQYFRFIISFEQLLYREEYQHLQQQGCVHPSMYLCQLVRDYVSIYNVYPELENLILYQYTPCEETCEYIVPMEDAIQVLLHGVKTYGIIFPCNIIYHFHIHHFIEGCYPSLDEILTNDYSVHEQMTQVMNQNVNEFWNSQSSGLPKDHFTPTLVTHAYEEYCAICQESMKEGEYVITLPCKHTFHSQKEGCNGIEEWYTKMDTCPLCKHKLT
jgi:Ring finger domain